MPGQYKALSLVLGVIICAQIARSYSPLVGGKDDKCETLTYGICRTMDYNRTIFPNFLGHRQQNEAAAAVDQFRPLMDISCSPDILTFVCSVYFPMCTSINKVIAPCRSLCLGVKNGCEKIMKRFGFSWPKELSCDRFPLLKTDICVFHNKTGAGSKATQPGVTTTRKKNSTIKEIIIRKPVRKYCPAGKAQKKSESQKTCCKCCQRGNRAARSGIAKCTLRKNFSKEKRFLKTLKECRPRKSKRCYLECCNAKRREISRKKKNRARNRNRKNRNRNRNRKQRIKPVG